MSRRLATILAAVLACLLGILVLLLGGCIHGKQKAAIQSQVEKALPPLPWTKLQSKERVPGLDEFPTPQPARVILKWECQPSDDAQNYVTGAEATTDLQNWQEVARVAYQPSVSLELTNRPPFEFYRVFTAIKTYEENP